MPAQTRLRDPARFFDHLRHSDVLGPVLTDEEVRGCEAITEACGRDGWPISWVAYALATAFHETAGEMRPIGERGGDAYFQRKYDPQGLNPSLARRLGNTQPGDGALFSGRGWVQLTGRTNYEKAEKVTGWPLIEQPDMALEPGLASAIMVAGMRDGWFTGRGLKHYLPLSGPAQEGAFISARRIINGTDRADLIAGYALAFQAALQAGGWA